MSSLPSHPQLVAGVDIAATAFLAAWARHGQAPATPRPFEQTPAGFAAFQQQLAATGVAPEATLVVLEATGSSWVALAVALHSAGYHVAVVNPAHVHNSAKSLPRRGKSDGLDARLLTQFGFERHPEPWPPPPVG
jgi:transposase